MKYPKPDIIAMRTTDWTEVSRIYTEGIQSGHATFEQACPAWEQWDKTHLQSGRLIALSGQVISGWAALSPVSGRCVYAGVAEVSIYISDHFRGQGIGFLLLNQLVIESEQNGIWTLQAGIFPENKASIRIHEKSGFRIVGVREKLGQMKDGAWRDVVLMERRNSFR